MKSLRIGTRGSPLALWQANHVAQLLAQRHGVATEIVRIRTSGDRLQSAPVSQRDASAEGKGIFIKELEDALLVGTVDLAVHSMKDVPTEIPTGLGLSAILPREDPRDCLIARDGRTLETLSAGARVGTSSLRRQAQLRHHRPDLVVVDVRGNVDTRLRKLSEGQFDAIILAMAGVNRLGFASQVTQPLDADVMLPAVGQGAIGVETRSNDRQTSEPIASLEDPQTRACVTAERALLLELQGGCQVPVGAWARIVNSELQLDAAVFSPDGRDSIRRSIRASLAEANGAGKRLGRILLEAGADKILRLVGKSVGLD